MTAPTEQTVNAINAFAEALQERVQTFDAEHFPEMVKFMTSEFTVSIGKKYAKIWKMRNHTVDGVAKESIHSFVNLENGDILMAASLNKPARHRRGNVYSDDLGMEAVTDEGYIVRLG